ncbi:hypothetical protein FACS189472_09170 [Alphaproteobacteria bacterium]|nr:hypothetical protein FACS189472_09170 [Alphaproteobacteria bacterium]
MEVIFAERMPEQFTKQYVKKLASYKNGRRACKKDLRKMPIAHILWHDLVNLTKERGEENEKNFTNGFNGVFIAWRLLCAKRFRVVWEAVPEELQKGKTNGKK